MEISVSDKRIRWWGVQSLEKNGEYINPWRIDYKDQNLYFEELKDRLRCAAGVKIAFISDTKSLKLNYKISEYERATFDVYVDGEMVENFNLVDSERVIFQPLKSGKKLVEVWLPPKYHISIKSIEIDDTSLIEFDSRNLKKWIVYGSSITQCGGAFSASRTWPSIVARNNSLDLTCLGVSGQCHLDIPIAMMIRDLPADYISLGLGINIKGGSSLSRRTFKSSVIGFIHLIREKHKTTPLMVNSPIFATEHEEGKNLVDLNLIKMREFVKEAVEVFQNRGDQKIYYVDGLTIFGKDLVEYLPDGVHPNGRGYELLAENYDKHVAKGVFGL